MSRTRDENAYSRGRGVWKVRRDVKQAGTAFSDFTPRPVASRPFARFVILIVNSLIVN